MKRVPLYLALVLVSAGARGADLRAQSTKVYGSRDGITVTIIRLEPADEGRAIVVVNGSDSHWDDRPLLHRLVDKGNHLEMQTRDGKEDHATLFGSRSGGDVDWELRLPDHKGAVSLGYDKKRTAKASPEPILGRYLRLKPRSTSGKADRASEEKALARYVALTDRACGTKLAATIEWASVPEEMTKDHEIAGFCEPVLFALRGLCRDDVGKKAIREKVKGVACRIGERLELKGPTGGKLQWTATRKPEDDAAFAKAYFLEHL